MQSCSLWCFRSYLSFKCAGVAPLPPRYRKILDESVKTFAVFPSCEQLLDCDDNCMLSVPLSTSDIHYSRWHSREIYQVLSTGVLRCFSTWSMVPKKIYSHPLSLLCCCLALSFVCSLFPVLFCLTLRLFAPVCDCHRDSLTRGEADNCAGIRACVLLLSLLDWFCT